MEDKGTNFALLAIVAIVAIVALIVLLKAQTQPKMVTLSADNNAGQMMRHGGGGYGCSFNGEGDCTGTCADANQKCGGTGCWCS